MKADLQEELAPPPRRRAAPRSHDCLGEVKLQGTVELGAARLTIRRLLTLAPGSILELDKLQGEALEVRANGNLIARGEAVIVNDRYAVRITEVVSPPDGTEKG